MVMQLLSENTKTVIGLVEILMKPALYDALMVEGTLLSLSVKCLHDMEDSDGRSYRVGEIISVVPDRLERILARPLDSLAKRGKMKLWNKEKFDH